MVTGGFRANNRGASTLATLAGLISLITAVLALIETLYRTDVIKGPSPIQRITDDETTSITDNKETPTENVTETPFLQTIEGGWTLQSWTETTSPTTIHIEVLSGSMTVESDDDKVDWILDIQETNEPVTPQPGIRCGGRVDLSSDQIVGEPGGDRNEHIDWTSDMSSISEEINLTFCGWNVGGTTAPFELAAEPSGAPSRLQMSNDRGTFVWTRQ
jgi:hypothetical protein